MILSIKPDTRRWIIVGTLFLAIVSNYLDRQLVSILKPTLMAFFGIDNSGYAVIANVFTLCYALMYPVTGWLVDRFGIKFLMTGGMIIWSGACVLGGLSTNMTEFTIARALLGIAEPIVFTAQLSVVTIWFSGSLRATANSLCAAGGSIGTVVAPILIAWLATVYNWHFVFIAAGAVGFVIVIFWMLIYRTPPPEVLAVTTADSVGMSKDGEVSFTWGQLWTRRSLWGILLIRFITDPVWYFCLFWLPGYLQEELHVPLSDVGKIAWIPYLIAAVGGVSASAFSDRMVRKGMNPLKSRKLMLSGVTIFAPLCALIPLLSTVVPVLAVFSVVAAVCLSWLYAICVVMAESFPRTNVASVLGIAGGCGALGAILFNYLVGQFIAGPSAERLFYVMAFLHAIGVVILWTMVRPEVPKNIQAVKE